MKAHPRSRGEHLRGADLGSECSGSSPLARGTRIGEMPGRASNRLIPARAGNTFGLPTLGRANLAHPRSRGEHPPIKNIFTGAVGSSPLARGTPCANFVISQLERLIPARAGNTPKSRSFTITVTAHPRSRGEHFVFTEPKSGALGSSPLARGTLLHYRKEPPSCRLIPARAGNTFWAQCLDTESRAHPRSRGEHTC